MINDWIESLDKDIISVVIPTYNRPNFLYNALSNLTVQKNPPKFEVIIVDDGSVEPKKELNKNVSNYFKSQLDINYIKLNENSGTVSIPRNIGISHIKGRTIAPTDDDCWSEPTKLSSLFNAMKSNQTFFAYGNRRESILQNGLLYHFKNVDCGSFHQKDVGIDNGQFIYDASVFKTIKPHLAINACDWELYKQIADISKFAFVDEIVCNYILHANNTSKTQKPHRVNPVNVVDKFEKYFKDGAFKDLILKEKSNV